MPFVFLIVGVLFLVVAVRGTQADAYALLKSEFAGNNSFVPWVLAILILGAIGYARPVRKPADAMIGLIVLAMFLANRGGVFAALNNAIANPVAPTASPAASGTLPGLAPPAAPSSPLPGIQLPYFANPGTPLAPGFEPPATGGGFGQY